LCPGVCTPFACVAGYNFMPKWAGGVGCGWVMGDGKWVENPGEDFGLSSLVAFDVVVAVVVVVVRFNQCPSNSVIFCLVLC